MTYLEREKKLQQMISEGAMMEAFEKFYHEDVIMIEATGEVREGKVLNRSFEQEWMEGLEVIHDGGVLSITSNEEEGITTAETWIDVSFKDGSRMKMEEVSIKKWEGDQIINERFYYDTGEFESDED